jgi:nicotinate-nucleotide adenylyltransferase
MGRSVGKRIGILGGTFNPVHKGHLYVAEQALRKLRLDKVIFVPAYMPPHKKISGNVSARDRVRMLRLAVTGKRRFSVSEYEIRARGASYSIRTARFLKRKSGKDTELFFLVGADSLAELGSWKDILKLLGLLRFVAVSRPGFSMKSGYTGLIKLRVPGKAISSSNIRKLIREGKTIRRFVPERVSGYIKRHGLYGK